MYDDNNKFKIQKKRVRLGLTARSALFFGFRTAEKPNGFIALTSAVIISSVLLVLATTVSATAFFSRFNSLNTEYKRISLGLAESCVNSALLKIAQNYTYAPAAGGDVVNIGSDTCIIRSAPYTTLGNKRTYTITVQASYKGAFSNIIVSAVAQDPTVSVVPPPLNVTVGSWQEVPQ